MSGGASSSGLMTVSKEKQKEEKFLLLYGIGVKFRRHPSDVV